MNSENFYNKNAIEFNEGTVDVDMTKTYEPFLELVKDGGHILDAGCGSGRDSLYFIQHGYKVTAIDASDAMVALASKLIGQPVLLKRFQEIDFVDEFDAIWACASLLHVNRNEIDDVLNRLSTALRTGGILYASFKYGDMEVVRDGRYFNYYDEASFGEVLEKQKELKVIKMWKADDARPDRKDESWLNVLVRKD